MFSSKKAYVCYNSKDFYKSVSSKWIFEYYLNITLPVSDWKFKMKSAFNSKDTNPSMYIYYETETSIYKFKCFSTGKRGDAVTLVMFLFDLKYDDACKKIEKDYKSFKSSGEVYKHTGKKFNSENPKHITKWKLINYTTRNWKKIDAKYWLQYGIGTSILTKYNVVPLESFKLGKLLDNLEIIEEFEVKKPNLYGYFTEDGELYKIYNPNNPDKKFFKVTDYVQGTDQIENHDVLVIMSSLKDILTVKQLGFRIDCIAPNSENSYFTEEDIEYFKEKYKAVLVCFDSDNPGIKSMIYYREKFGLNLIYIDLEKDISDVRKIHGKQRVIEEFYIKLQKGIEKTLSEII